MMQHLELAEKELEDVEEQLKIDKTSFDTISIIFSDEKLKECINKLSSGQNIEKLNIDTLGVLSESFYNASKKLRSVVEDINIRNFLEHGYRLDVEELKRRFKLAEAKQKIERLKRKESGKDVIYSEINIEKMCKLYENPPRYIATTYDSNKKILVDKVIFRKFMIAIIQMLLNQMDLMSAYSGGEGLGKTVLMTQHARIINYIQEECNVIKYGFSVKGVMFNSLSNLKEARDETFGDKHKMFLLDEGSELHRRNWREPLVQDYFQRLRRERYERRINKVSLPVLGELDTNIILARVNFVFQVEAKSDVKTGLLDKGYGKLVIIPRGDSIYSYYHKKELTRGFIKTELQEALKDKEYLKGIPNSIVVKQFKFNGVNGFDEIEYEKLMKDTNKSFTTEEGIKLGITRAYMIHRSGFSPKKLGITTKDPEYATLIKFRKSLREFFVNNPKILKNEEEKFKAKYSHSA